MRRPRSTALLLSSLSLLILVRAGHAAPRCAAHATVTAVPGVPGAFRIETAHGTTVARHAPRAAAPAAGAALFVVSALDTTFDVDGDPATVHDTLFVPVGSTVRWQLVTGIHTVTNGHDSGDPEAGTRFSYLLDGARPTFDSTFSQPTTLYFFCYFHEPVMGGTLIVHQDAGVPGGAPPAAAAFSRLPAPNPARGAMTFAIALPREEQVEITVLDLAGRRVATLARDRLAAGEHAFTWDGAAGAGARAPAGQYRVRLRAGGVDESRAFSLVR
ncbi:MAG: hypothetical protein HZC42_14605 [Candidatus Eisenbacteria bacterium]|nr:hypothetical protein [Candidatus Eisenbacteria bacterium]